MRRESAWALGNLRDARAVKPLIPLLDEENPDVPRAPAEALQQIGDKRGLRAVEKPRAGGLGG